MDFRDTRTGMMLRTENPEMIKMYLENDIYEEVKAVEVADPQPKPVKKAKKKEEE